VRLSQRTEIRGEERSLAGSAFSNNRLSPALNQPLILWKLLRPNSCRFQLESDLKKESRPGCLRDPKSSSKAALLCVQLRKSYLQVRLRRCTSECKIVFYAP